MKKYIMCFMAICLSLTILPLQSNAAINSKPSSAVSPTPAESAEIKTLELRLTEIKAMDKSELKSAEKKSLRKEVKSINHKLRDVSGGIYVSAGALIVILILLVILT